MHSRLQPDVCVKRWAFGVGVVAGNGSSVSRRCLWLLLRFKFATVLVSSRRRVVNVLNSKLCVGGIVQTMCVVGPRLQDGALNVFSVSRRCV